MIPDIDADRTSDGPKRDLVRGVSVPRGIALLGWVVGATCLLLESWPMGPEYPKAVVHVLFGLLLCGLVVARFNWWIQRCPPNDALDIRRFSRELSRMVYLILYLVIGLQLIIRIRGYLQDDHHIAHGLNPLRPALNDQAFLVSGLLALVLIRVLAWWSWRRLRQFSGVPNAQ